MKFFTYLMAGSALLLACSGNPATAQNYKWVKGTSVSLTTAKIAMDGAGNVLTSGTFTGDVDFNFSNGAADTAFLYGGGSFLAKYDADGNYGWSIRLGNNADTLINIKAVQSDDSGNVYITGEFKGVVDFNPSNGAADTAIETSAFLSNAYRNAMYVARYNADGSFGWVMNLGGYLPQVWDMALRNQKLYITGSISTFTTAPVLFRNVDFNPSKLQADTFYLPAAPGTTSGRHNPFFAVYDLNAHLVAAKRLYGTIVFRGQGIDADAAGNIYIGGTLRGTHDLNPSLNPADTFFLAGTQGQFLASYTDTGAFRWAVPVLAEDNYGFVSPENPFIVKATGNGNVYVSGLFKSTIDFNPGAAPGDTLSLTASAGNGGSSYLAHYDTAGHFIKAHTLQASGEGDRINAIATDDSGHVFIAGEFNGTADFNFSALPADTANLKSAGTNIDPDIFFAKYDSNDALVWARKVGNAESQYLTGMAVRGKDLRIYGRFGGDVVFNPMPPVDASSRLMGGGTYLAAYRTYPPSSAKQLLTYSFATPAATGTITASDSVLVTVPAGTTVNGLVANFTVSPLAIATVGATAQVSGTTANNFSNVVTYTIMAEDSSTRDYYVKVTVELPIGIDEISQDNASFKVWPNPASNQLNFEHPADVKLFDINGKLVLSATKVRALPIGRLAAGVYILENEQGQKRKIIKH